MQKSPKQRNGNTEVMPAEDDLLIKHAEADADTDDEQPESQQAPSTTDEKRKAQRAIFKNWVLDKAKEVTLEQVKNELNSKNDEELSIRNLLQKQERPNTIKNPREYQLELYERAKKENTIAVLETGSGKTLIAVLLLRHIIDEELERRAAGQPHRISFFLVDSVTLVFQQSAVLECNLDHTIAHFCGAMGVELWDASVWQKHFKSNMVIVCTAEVLYQCLCHSFLRMNQINLLVFDEAHHAKKDHPYAKIMRDFYVTDTEHPRIFGMTASPVDAKVDVLQAARELEALLHAKIATTTSGSLADHISRAVEHNLVYPRLDEPFETPLYQQMKSKFGRLGFQIHQRLFAQSKDASAHLGAWASDMFWQFALADEQAQAEVMVARYCHKSKINHSVSQLDNETRLLREAAEIVANHKFGTPKLNEEDLSSKVLTLSHVLNQHFSRPTSNKCLIFVERRQTARLLALIFSYIGPTHLRVGLLAGNNGKLGDFSQSLHQQVVTMAKFRNGELNCLFATSVAEEGLDIPECNLVIRFDLYRSMIQFIQSRGRARQKHSKFIHMVEHGNALHDQIIRDAQKAARKMQEFCKQQPEDRLLKGDSDDADEKLRRQLDEKEYKFVHPNTGATLTYNSALVVLAHFCAVLPTTETSSMLEPTYIISMDGGKFIYEVMMPEESPIRSAIGHPSKRKAIAKRAAAFKMCVELLKAQYLDANLLPIYKKVLPLMRNARLALNSHKKNSYRVRIKPALWDYGRGLLPTELFLSIIHLSAGLDRPHQPLGLLTRTLLPTFPEFPLFLTSGRVSIVKVETLREKLAVDIGLTNKLTTLTLRVFKDIFNKGFEKNPAMMSWWIVPLLSDPGADPVTKIDWAALNTTYDHDDFRWTPDTPSDFLKDKFFVDPWDGGRRAFTIGVHPQLKAWDPVPTDVVVRKTHSSNILEYSVSLWKKCREKRSWDEHQPVVEAEQMLYRRNFLAVPSVKEAHLRSKTFLCPQPMRISTLSTRFVASCIVFPAIIHRLEDYLIALSACDLVGIRIDPALALEAVTKDSDNSDEHTAEKINFRPGMGSNYERLEFIGDCFLKMATSIVLFCQRPNDDEFQFHVRRMCLICNANLFNTAKDKLELPEYVRTLAFSRRLWYPEGIKMLEGKGAGKNQEIQRHSLADKSVADVCEALIGAAFVQYNQPGCWRPEQWDAAVKAVTKFVNSNDHTMVRYAEYLAAYEKPAYQTAEVTASQLDLATKVELEHNYRFRYPRLLRSAFCHPSYPFSWEKIPSYQRLEFLGDSLLDTACVTHLFYRYPSKDPQWMTEHKMAMVSNRFLGALCVKLGFHRHLRYQHQQLEFQIREYVAEVREAERESKGSVDYWTSMKQPPKCLPDILEAYIGAIFVDSDFNYGEVQRFFDEHIKCFFENMAIYDTFANNHPTTHLHNLLSIDFGCRDYRLMAEELPEITPGAPPKVIAAVMIHDKIVADGIAQSGRYAKLNASIKALELIKGLAPYEFQMTFGCDCNPTTGDGSIPDIGSNI